MLSSEQHTQIYWLFDCGLACPVVKLGSYYKKKTADSNIIQNMFNADRVPKEKQEEFKNYLIGLVKKKMNNSQIIEKVISDNMLLINTEAIRDRIDRYRRKLGIKSSELPPNHNYHQIPKDKINEVDNLITALVLKKVKQRKIVNELDKAGLLFTTKAGAEHRISRIRKKLNQNIKADDKKISDKCEQLFKSGKTFNEIAKEMNLTYSSVYMRLRARGLAGQYAA